MKTFLKASFAVMCICAAQLAHGVQDFSQYNLHYGKLNHLSSETAFHKVKADAEFVVFKFSANWCGPCQRLTPILNKIASQFNNVLFIEINIDSFPALTKEYSIKSFPTLILFNNGSQVQRATSLHNEAYWTNVVKTSFNL